MTINQHTVGRKGFLKTDKDGWKWAPFSLPSLSQLPFVLPFFSSLSHYHHWSWPWCRASSCVPQAHRQTSDPELNCRIIHHCQQVTCTAPRSLSAPLVSIQLFSLSLVRKKKGVYPLTVMHCGEETSTNGKIFSLDEWAKWPEISPVRQKACLQPTLAVIYREPRT